jgi:hypothetical protein
MNDLKGTPGELRCTITIKRAATGKEETYNLTGSITPEQIEADKPKEPDHGSNA